MNRRVDIGSGNTNKIENIFYFFAKIELFFIFVKNAKKGNLKSLYSTVKLLGIAYWASGGSNKT